MNEETKESLIDERESIEETLHLLQSPANAKHLLDGIRELDAGRVRYTNSSTRHG